MVVNLVMIVGLMAVFEATLTHAGHRRARAHGRHGRRRERADLRAHPRGAPRGQGRARRDPTGFDKAFWTIFDAHVTTLLTAVVLYNYGTGPIKGFAVTLAVGLIVNMFCALIITRQLYALYPDDRPVEQLSI